MEKDCCVVVTHLHQGEMVVDPNNYDVSELREQAAADDTSDNESDDHGFNWVTDQESTQADDDPDDETDAFAPKDQWQSTVNKERQSGRENQRSHRKQRSRESSQRSSRENADPDDHSPSKFFTSQDGGRILPRQRTEESDPIADDDPDEGSGYERKEERKTRRREDNEVRRREDRDVEGRENEGEEPRRQRLERLGIDPINYDLGALRTVTDQNGPELDTEAHGFVWSEPPEQYRTRVEDPTSEQHKRLLTIAGIDPDLIGEKPYLTTLPTEAAGSFVIDWLEFLTGEAGTKGAIDALARYQEIGWFTARVENELKNSMRWIDNRDGDGFSVFDQGDHLLSFAYVAKIASINSEGMMFY